MSHGFMDLQICSDFVHKDAIENYKREVPGKASMWSKQGCDRWFTPDQTNAEGDFCIEAATQSTFSCLGAEPGITAFHQLLTKHKGQKLFRDGASLNIIFVADTHDPGLNNQTLKSKIPSYAQLKKAIGADNKPSSIKFHAIAPKNSCTGEGLWDYSYFNLARKAGGIESDSCNSADYSKHLEDISDISKVAESGIFALSKTASSIASVTINGKIISSFSINSEKNVITIPDLTKSEKHQVVVTYYF